MPPITSSRAGTRATQTSPLLKKPAKPVGSLFGLRRSSSNSEISNGCASFIGCRRDDATSRACGHARKSTVVAEQPFAVCEQIPDDQNVQPKHDEQPDFGMMNNL